MMPPICTALPQSTTPEIYTTLMATIMSIVIMDKGQIILKKQEEIKEEEEVKQEVVQEETKK